MPIVNFGLETRRYKRFYTRYFGTEDSAVMALANHATSENDSWRTAIENWQTPILQNEQLPEWYRSAIFNELYYVCDGSTIWFDFDSSWKEFEPDMTDLTSCQLMKYGRFGYMESWEYYMFNTYDVHFYASWALLENWPQLEMSIQMDFCDQIYRTETKQVVALKEGTCIQAKKYARTPHDLGHPLGEPWSETNAYILHDTGEWKDLNLKFVLLCWRDWKIIGLSKMPDDEAENLLRFFYERSKVIINTALLDWDIDGDGMIENSGIADQTYDVWTMSGTSAYCGSLWLAALSVTMSMADKLKLYDESTFFKNILSKATFAFNSKLWNGKYFDFDESKANKGTIMADQLCGVWFQTMIDGDVVLSENQIQSSLNTIYTMNVCSFADGKMGSVNGIKENGIVDTSSIQSEEVWTGIAYAIASFLIAKGKINEGLLTAHGVFESCWNRFGLQYQTPEAIYEKKYYRAIGYMRPLSIWAIQHAIQKKTI